ADCSLTPPPARVAALRVAGRHLGELDAGAVRGGGLAEFVDHALEPACGLGLLADLPEAAGRAEQELGRGLAVRELAHQALVGGGGLAEAGLRLPAAPLAQPRGRIALERVGKAAAHRVGAHARAV